MWNPRTCNCECNKACRIDENLDIKNYEYKKYLLDLLELVLDDKK